MLPKMYGKSIERDGVDNFGGMNTQARIADNEFSHMINMSGEEYPCITTRAPRGRLRRISKPNGMIANGHLAWVDGTSFWFGGKEHANAVEDSPKTMVAMGAQIIIFPDKKRFNIVTEQFDPLEHRVEPNNVTAYICTLNGNPYTYTTEKPAEPEDGAYFLDTEVNGLYMYSAALASWSAVPTVFVKIEATGIGAGFKVNDGVTISGLGADIDGTHIVRTVSTDYIVVIGIIRSTINVESGVTVSRTIPDMDFVCEQNNRLWGCRYGTQGDAFVNEVYACALGDPTNWHQFDGTSMDSYVMSLGSAGAFSGMVSHLGYVMAMKQDVIHKVYGNHPNNFQIADTRARGIAYGSSASAAIAQETLLYLSPDDACAIGTGLPSGISTKLADMELHSGVGGIYKRDYYLSALDKHGDSHMLVYDTETGAWYREDGLRAVYMASCEGDLFMIATEDGVTYNLYNVSGDLQNAYAYKPKDENDEEEPAEVETLPEWELTSGLIGLRLPEHKYITQFMLRMETMGEGDISLEVRYDNEEDWRSVYATHTAQKDNVRISVRPRHCDTMQYRLSGTGQVRLYSIVKHTETAEEY